ncbi:hypothetical protein PEX1_027200 [Penicillium expansum]|uniref:Uncharacterized protein n=1 Tax=Penicillium expansum TaxID=27334 RepID=A0A0A2K917_PENEN|nr:hypothetical protein PEX2_011820 [Penicillium expansum]KGO40695.1 hypothetical protein PEXP_071940 [Penicillium expansum]KGO63393.1 hypothetical protein PEX2_011820 [Penicillium expansum]KGO70790.1 hypothetical protein PEX1_027200 [Penicillium expansum]
MDFIRVIPLFSFFFTAVVAFPQQTAAGTTTAPPTTITKAASLSCSDGETAVYTRDCTMGTPTSYCARPEPPIQCSEGYFPSVWHPGHCMEQSTCFPLDASWITTECSHGAIPWTTSTLYEGTLAGGQSTIISAVSCSCARDQWYSMTILPGASTVDTFCMPSSSCPAGMTTSVSTNTYCATAPASACSNVPLETNYCKCEDTTQTPVYPDSVGAAPTGCRA